MQLIDFYDLHWFVGTTQKSLHNTGILLIGTLT